MSVSVFFRPSLLLRKGFNEFAVLGLQQPLHFLCEELEVGLQQGFFRWLLELLKFPFQVGFNKLLLDDEEVQSDLRLVQDTGLVEREQELFVGFSFGGKHLFTDVDLERR